MDILVPAYMKEEKKMENMAKMWISLFEILRICYITDHSIFVYYLFFTCSLP